MRVHIYNSNAIHRADHIYLLGSDVLLLKENGGWKQLGNLEEVTEVFTDEGRIYNDKGKYFLEVEESNIKMHYLIT